MGRGRSDGGGIGEAFVSTWIVTLSNYLHSFHSAAATALRSTQRLWANYVCRCVQVKSNSYHMFSINMLVQCNLCQSICCERQGQGRNQLQRWRVEAIFALSSKSSSLSLFALATSFSLSLPSFFLSFPVCPTQQHKRQRHRTYLRTRTTSAAAAAPARRVTTIRTTARRSTFWFQYRLFGAHTNLLDEFI